MSIATQHHADTAVEFLDGSRLAGELLKNIKSSKPDPALLFSAVTSMSGAGRRGLLRQVQKFLEGAHHAHR